MSNAPVDGSILKVSNRQRGVTGVVARFQAPAWAELAGGGRGVETPGHGEQADQVVLVLERVGGEVVAGLGGVGGEAGAVVFGCGLQEFAER